MTPKEAKPVVVKVEPQELARYLEMISASTICQGKLRGVVDVRGYRYAVVAGLYSDDGNVAYLERIVTPAEWAGGGDETRA